MLLANEGELQLMLCIFRLVDELVLLYKESATRSVVGVQVNHILEMLATLQK